MSSLDRNFIGLQANYLVCDATALGNIVQYRIGYQALLIGSATVGVGKQQAYFKRLGGGLQSNMTSVCAASLAGGGERTGGPKAEQVIVIADQGPPAEPGSHRQFSCGSGTGCGLWGPTQVVAQRIWVIRDGCFNHRRRGTRYREQVSNRRGPAAGDG